MASTPFEPESALAKLLAIHSQQAELLVKRRVIDALKQIKAEFVPIAEITDNLDKIKIASHQLGALDVIDKVLDVIK